MGGADGSGAPGGGGSAAEAPLSDPTDRSPAPGVVLYAFAAPADIAAAQPTTATTAGNLNAQATLSWDGEQGDPDAGSLRIAAPFGAYDQQIELQFPFAELTDLSGQVLYVRVKMDEGFNQDRSAPGGLIFYAQSGEDYAWGQAEWTNVNQSATGKWREYAFDLNYPYREVSSVGVQGSALAFDPTRVRLLGLIIHTGGGGSSTLPPAPAVLHIDSLGHWDPKGIQ